jgi:hypothetical protein
MLATQLDLVECLHGMSSARLNVSSAVAWSGRCQHVHTVRGACTTLQACFLHLRLQLAHWYTKHVAKGVTTQHIFRFVYHCSLIPSSSVLSLLMCSQTAEGWHGSTHALFSGGAYGQTIETHSKAAGWTYRSKVNYSTS